MFVFEGASPETADAEGRTPLLMACWQGNEALVSALTEFRADPNACDQVTYCLPFNV